MEEKNLSSLETGCPSCGATMRYSPAHVKMRCDNCQTCKDIEFEPIKEKQPWSDRNKATASTKEWAETAKNLKCPNCGAAVVLGSLEYSKVCPYCSSSLVADEDNANIAEPDGIIPFKLSDEEASKLYVKGVKKKFFAPRAFKKAPPTENIHGVYVPSFSYDSNTTSEYKGVLATDHTTGVGDKRRTYTTYKHIKGTHQANLVDIVVESSSKLNQAQMNELLPYNMENVVKFKQGFIMGYTVEQYQNTTEECLVVAKKEMEQIIKKQILSKYSYDRVNSFELKTQYTNIKYLYYLLPVYKCAYNYKNKTYTTFMNGQTGKVGGGYPISGLKVFLVVLFAIAFLAGIIALTVAF